MNGQGPWSNRKLVVASVFGGPDDPTAGIIGNWADNLELEPLCFAELSTNLVNSANPHNPPGTPPNDYAALGKAFGLARPLMYRERVLVTTTVKPVHRLILSKLDVGFGGGGIDNVRKTKADNPAIDLYHVAAKLLGLPADFLGRVYVQYEQPR